MKVPYARLAWKIRKPLAWLGFLIAANLNVTGEFLSFVGLLAVAGQGILVGFALTDAIEEEAKR